ncbi:MULTISPECIES: hypothetical protein [Burkholderia cepacia complex]|uniref:hypothetical protein n=1 Tax=Burkholderia cepacia complex TaxID=87882 RepID=UPI000CFFDD2D|nr:MULTISPECIES: hypothetical protein [Burkholderia cepacia complex]MBR7894448.1 hypothetical protein [Burkholderia multivorans]MBR8434315.1 hypothetical protein [Burkholderia cenocepacia]PRE05948.1 hypothetical protein C6P91_11165 [Burkholderia multivorans]
MATKSTKALSSMSASGFGIIQVAGDLSITQVLQQDQAAVIEVPRLSREERSQLSALTEEVVAAESGLISARLVRASLNLHLGVKSVEEMTADMFPRATVYLNGWRNCAAGRELSLDAMIAQMMRIWAIVPHLKTSTLEFTRTHFSREVLRNMSVWELRAALAFTMAKWSSYWEARNA